MRVISTDCGVSKCMHFVIFSIKSMRLAEKSKKVRERENKGRNEVLIHRTAGSCFGVCKTSTGVLKTNTLSATLVYKVVDIGH